MSEELKNRTKKFALDVIVVCAAWPQVLETRHAIGQVVRSSSSIAANYRAACRGKSKADFISKLGTVEEEADETGFWLEMLRDIAQLRHLKVDARVSAELTRLLDEANQLVAITVASRKTARAIMTDFSSVRHSTFTIRNSFRLAPQGMAGFVLANGSMSSHQSGDGDIRQVVFAPAWRTIKDAIRSSISTSQNQTHAAI